MGAVICRESTLFYSQVSPLTGNSWWVTSVQAPIISLERILGQMSFQGRVACLNLGFMAETSSPQCSQHYVPTVPGWETAMGASCDQGVDWKMTPRGVCPKDTGPTLIAGGYSQPELFWIWMSWHLAPIPYSNCLLVPASSMELCSHCLLYVLSWVGHIWFRHCPKIDFRRKPHIQMTETLFLFVNMCCILFVLFFLCFFN